LKPLISQFFELGKEKNLNQLAKNYSIFYPKKIVTSSPKYGLGIWDPKKPIPDPEIKEAPEPGSGSATLPTSICIFSAMLTVIS